MNEEDAVFKLGKRLSELRNFGDELPTDPVKVGSSWVSPEELADEYDKHFPPGPRRFRQATSAVYRYKTQPCHDPRGFLTGVEIECGEQSFDFLKNRPLIREGSAIAGERIKTTPCNRYDTLFLDDFTLVIDKVTETASVVRGRYRVANLTFCEETPIAGDERLHLSTADRTNICSVHFPFIPFSKFWKVWDGYVEFRKRQIAELRDSERTWAGDGHWLA